MVLFCFRAMADQPPSTPAGLPIGDVFGWDQGVDLLLTVPGTRAFANPPPDLNLSYFGSGPVVYTLRTLGPAVVSQITSKHYAVVGHVRYAGVPQGSFLELENWFAPTQPGGPELYFYSRTMAEAGPMAKIEGTDDGRDFALPFDSTGAKTPLVRLVMKLHLAGAGKLEFSDVRLVQYPDGPPTTGDSPAKAPAEIMLTLLAGKDGVVQMGGIDYAATDALGAALKQRVHENADVPFVIRGTENVPYVTVKQLLDVLRTAGARNIFFATSSSPEATAAATGPAMAPSPSIDWRSFSLGVLATIVAIFGFAGLFVLGRRFRGLRHARELRRIASLDG